MAKAPKKKNSSPKKKAKQTVKRKKPLFWRATKWLMVLGLWGGIFLAGVLLWYAKDLPSITQTATFERRSLIVVKAQNGETLARYGESKGENLKASNLPEHLVNAVLATEDRRFYSHFGIDPLGFTRAMVTNVMKRRFAQGGSTITQQLAKNLFLTHQRKLTRKIQEAMLAIWLEQKLTKNEILSAYMNRVYLGSGTYGFNAAAKLYFGKEAKNVTLHEAAILAGLLKAPSRYSPHNSLKKAKERAQVVLSAMVDAGYITEDDLTDENMRISLPNHRNQAIKSTRYFTDWVLDGLDDLIGRPDMDLTIETTLDAPLQSHAHNVLVKAIDQADEMKFVSQGAVLMMAPDGAVLSMVGGYDYGQSQFNRTTLARRAPGSAFKPFIYLSAIEQGWDDDDTILDAPITEGSYRPKNFADKYYGKTTLEHALSKSMNTATIRLANEVGMSSILKTTKKLGIISKLERDLSLTLGSSGVSMLEMGTAYAVLSNGGHRIFPYAITRITSGEGRILYERKAPARYQSLFRGEDIRTISSMMENVITEGTGKRARLPFPVSGKTGTSQDSRDAWFAGYSDKIVSVVWLGNDDNSPMRRVTGGSIPAEIWRDVMLFGNKRHGTTNIPKTHSDNKKGGFSALLGRLMSSDDTPPKPPRKRNDYSNLND